MRCKLVALSKKVAKCSIGTDDGRHSPCWLIGLPLESLCFGKMQYRALESVIVKGNFCCHVLQPFPNHFSCRYSPWLLLSRRILWRRPEKLCNKLLGIPLIFIDATHVLCIYLATLFVTDVKNRCFSNGFRNIISIDRYLFLSTSLHWEKSTNTLYCAFDLETSSENNC